MWLKLLSKELGLSSTKPSNRLRQSVAMFLYSNKWVLCSSAKTESGLYIDIPPVRMVSHADAKQLTNVLTELMNEPVTVIANNAIDPICNSNAIAEAVGLKHWMTLYRRSRLINVQCLNDRIVVEEWRREGLSFPASPPLWSKRFGPDDLPTAVLYIIKQTANYAGHKEVASPVPSPIKPRHRSKPKHHIN